MTCLTRLCFAILILLLTTFLSLAPARAGNVVQISGFVYDAESSSGISHATVRIVETGLATQTNAEGAYRFVTVPGQFTVRVSHVGYHGRSHSVEADSGTIRLDFHLAPVPIQLGEQKVYTRAYDPGQRIIVEAIKRKADILSRVQNYSFDAYAKLLIENITDPDSQKILLITETQSTAYWEKPDKFKEVIASRRQTSNLKAEQNLVTVGELLNFNRNRIDIGEYSIVSPTAEDALDYYNYYLIDTVLVDDRSAFLLEIDPRNEYLPLFTGTIQIVDSTFDVVAVDVGFSKGVQLPFLSDGRYYQHLTRFGDRYWLPVEIGFSAKITFGLPIPGIPKELFLEHTAVIHDYRIDQDPPPDVFDEYRLVVADRADDVDSASWDLLQKIPLTDFEKEGYRRIDSIKNAPQPIGKHLLKGVALAAYLYFEGYYDAFHFNRVEGWYLGLGINRQLSRRLRLRLKGGYAFSEADWQYAVGGGWKLSGKPKVWAGGIVKDEIVARPTIISEPDYNPTFNSFLFKIDPLDYYREKGISGFVSVNPLGKSQLTLRVNDFRHLSLPLQVRQVVFRDDVIRRDNPPVQEGLFRSASLELTYDSRPLIDNKGRDIRINTETYSKSRIKVEYANPDFLGGPFDFQSVIMTIDCRFRFGGVGITRLFASAGISGKALPPQRYFIVDFNDPDFFNPKGFNTLGEHNFAGNRDASIYIDHSFGKFALRHFPQPLRQIPFGLGVHGGVFWSTFTGSEAAFPHERYYQTAPRGYGEIGFSVSNLTPFLGPLNSMVRFTWQISNYRTLDWLIHYGVQF